MSRAGAIAFTAAATTLLLGCAVGPNYARPQVPVQPQYRFVEGAGQAQSLADLPWWQVFDDSALQTLLWDAVANNLDLRTAAARVEERWAELMSPEELEALRASLLGLLTELRAQ